MNHKGIWRYLYKNIHWDIYKQKEKKPYEELKYPLVGEQLNSVQTKSWNIVYPLKRRQ